MTYCSSRLGLDPESLKGNARGFDSSTVYKTYDEYTNDDERAFLEFFFRDVYAAYGYDFHYYQGEPVDEAWVRDRIAHFTRTNGFTAQRWESALHNGIRFEKSKEIWSRSPNSLTKISRQTCRRFWTNSMRTGFRWRCIC